MPEAGGSSSSQLFIFEEAMVAVGSCASAGNIVRDSSEVVSNSPSETLNLTVKSPEVE